MNKSIKVIIIVVIQLVVFATPAVHAASSDVVFLPVEQVSVVTAKGPVSLALEVARTDLQRERGLMNRWQMPDHHGMLFLFPQAEPLNFWMKNTYISLDIIFIDQKGVVLNIARHTKPESTDLIPSEGEAMAVIELGGGEAERLHIAKGDRVVYPVFHE